jgi:hypothetical protein
VKYKQKVLSHDATPSAVRYKNWKFYYTMMGKGGFAAFGEAETFHWTMIDNIGRDPFEQNINIGGDTKSAMSFAGAIAAPMTAYLYDWNILPIGQLLWTKELESYIKYAPLQAPETYNLTQVLEQVKKYGAKHMSQ